jgi:hypothetical protein
MGPFLYTTSKGPTKLGDILAHFPNLIELLCGFTRKKNLSQPHDCGQCDVHQHKYFFDLVLLESIYVLPFLGTLSVPPRPYPLVYPNSEVSDMVIHKENQTVSS